MSLSNIDDKGERAILAIFAVRERKLIAKVSVTNNIRQRKVVRGNTNSNNIVAWACCLLLYLQICVHRKVIRKHFPGRPDMNEDSLTRTYSPTYSKQTRNRLQSTHGATEIFRNGKDLN